MQKSITVFAQYITEGSNLEGILNGGEDYRTIGFVGSNNAIDVGHVTWNWDTLGKLSRACVLKDVTINYDCGGRNSLQPGDIGTFYHYPVKCTGFSVNGKNISGKFSSIGVENHEKFKGQGWFSHSATELSGVSRTDLIGYSNVKLGMHIKLTEGNNIADLKFHVKKLRATIQYSARYYARFFDENGNIVSSQLIEGGQRAAAPEQELQKTGYRISGWLCVNNGVTYTVLPTSEDTDLEFSPVYEPVYCRVIMPTLGNADCRIQVYDGTTGKFETKDRYYLNSSQLYCDIRYGSKIKVNAVHFNTLSEDLLVTINGSEKTVDGSKKDDICIFETESLTENATIEVQAKPVYFDITGEAGIGGSVTPPQRVLRFEDAAVEITPGEGYEISSVTVDGQNVNVSDKSGMTVAFNKVSAAHRVVAEFSRIQIPITLIHSENVTVDGSTTVEYGDEATWIFNTENGCSISKILLNGNIIVDTFEALSTYKLTLYGIKSEIAIEIIDSTDLVTVTFQPSKNGKITGREGTFIKGKGTLSFKAIPDDGYAFSCWTGAPWPKAEFQLDTANAESSYVLGAEFEKLSFSIETQTIGDGTIKATANFANYGDKVDFEAVAGEGWRFSKWEIQEEVSGEVLGVIAPTEPYFTHTIKGNLLVRAEFIYEEYTLVTTVKSPDGDSVGGTVTKSSDQGTYHFQDEIEITAVPDEGYRFVKWSDGVFSPRRTVSMPAMNVLLVAEFCRYEYEIIAEAAPNAVITLESNGISKENSLTVKYGDALTVKVICDYGYNVADVNMDDVSVKNRLQKTIRGAYYVIPAVKSAHRICVTLGRKTYTNARKLFDYWPPVIACIMEMQEIARVQQPLIDEAWDAVSSVLENQFIDSATEEGVRQWESELGITPPAADTLEQRKKRLKLKWVPDNRFTMPWLCGWLKHVCETDDIKRPEVKDYVLNVAIPAKSDYMTIFADLEKYKPANIALSPNIGLTSGIQNLKAGVGLRVTMKVKIESGDKT